METSEQNLPVDTQPNDPDWLPERLERARRTAINGLLEALGFADVEMLKTVLIEQRQSVEQLTQARDAQSQRAEASEQTRRSALIEAAFQLTSADYDFIDLDEVRALADFSSVSLAEDGSVIGMREAVEALVERRPHLLKRIPAVETDAGAGFGDDIGQPLTPQLVASVKKKFRLG